MAHPFGPEQVGDACLFHPGLVAVPEAVRRQSGQDWQLGRGRGVLGGWLAAPLALAARSVV